MIERTGYLSSAARRLARFIAFVIGLWVLFGPAGALAQSVPQSREQIALTFAPVVKSTARAVVNIYTSREVTTAAPFSPLMNDPFFRQFFGQNFGGMRPERRRIQNSLGSGVVIDPTGVVITNDHVIDGADQIVVVLNDLREFAAEVVGTDPRTDIAVLRIDTGGQALAHLPLGDSDSLEVGDLVLAIGNPFGVGQTVTSGIVSATARTTVGAADYRFFIQTDAAINPGNSGGALVDMSGTLVGLNTAIYSRSGGSIGIGFAIPTDMVRAVSRSILEHGRVIRPWLGAVGQTVTPDIAESLGLERPSGVLVNAVQSRSPAAEAGIRTGDIIVAVDDRQIVDTEMLRYRVATRALGAPASICILRNGRLRDLTVRMAPPPEDPPRNTTVLEGRHPLSGATVMNLSPAVIEELGLRREIDGVIVSEIARGSLADRLDFKPGDVIRKINDSRIASVRALIRALAEETRAWRVDIDRDGRSVSLSIRL